MAASEPARRGITSRILGPAPTYPNGSRARGLLPPTQEILENMGVLERLSAHVEPWRPNRLYDRNNQLLREVDVAANMAMLSTSGVPRRPMKVSQQHTETVLLEYLESYGVHGELTSNLANFTRTQE